jgi:hypothetical protein
MYHITNEELEIILESAGSSDAGLAALIDILEGTL